MIIALNDLSMFKDSFEYLIDTTQRTILFMDVLRKRGNIYLQHLKDGQPPVLTFNYDIILDGRTLDKPINYALAQIIPDEGVELDPKKRPIVVIDPRAGHGPGIGGSKRDSEIGIAMNNGHPVYFVLFYPEPMPEQTLADVEKGEVRFIEEVAKLHPDAEEPAVIGNCQAGWAVALIGADRPDVTGPLILNGSPMSYWAGVEGNHPMRYRGGLIGGSWWASFLSDLGNGNFDGAHLIANFEDLNPTNTYWTKFYNIYSKVDTEEKRFLNFEKWWNGYCSMSSEEIHFILDNLFIGDKLEKGLVKLDQNTKVNLKNLEDPMVIFASGGDNITPPQQALNWIAAVYGTEEEIKRQQQVIVYLLHKDIGHLGIFVSSKIAKKEHKEIIKSIDLVEYLSPGLYEMIIYEGEEKHGIHDYEVRFEERKVDDILALDDGQKDEESFPTVVAISKLNDRLYRTFARPWVRMWTNEVTTDVFKQLHPLRVSRYMFSDLNPFLLPFRLWAPIVKNNRQTIDPKNNFLKMEKQFSKWMETNLDNYRNFRDHMNETLFKSIYNNPIVKSLFSAKFDRDEVTPEPAIDVEKIATEMEKQDEEIELMYSMMDKGTFTEGMVRIMVAMANADHILARTELENYEKIVKKHERLRILKPSELKQMILYQSRLIQIDGDVALKNLTKLLPTKEERKEALEVAKSIAFADGVLAKEEEALLIKIKKDLKIESI